MGRRRVKRGIGPPPEPIVVPTTNEYNGNDGPWSTFAVRIGNPPQLVKLLASTSSPETWVVGPKGCTADDPPDCPVDRGQIFNAKASNTWTPWHNESVHALDYDRLLPLSGRGLYGSDMLTLGHNDKGITLPNHTIALIASKDYFLGMIGLSPREPSQEKRREGHASNLVDLKSRGRIPSKSYGYTAGAKYRRQGPQARPAQAHLVLGGYNAALVKPNDVDFQMRPEDDARDLTVSVRSIGIESKSGGSKSLHDQGFSAVIDSGVSHYWLPPDACRAFEEAFKLVWNETVGLYFINEDQHTRLQAENPSVTFTLGNNMSGGSEVTLSLPYASFELRINAEYPLVPGWSRYFPVRKAMDPMQYTLGRAFLQETYLTANYEHRNFSVSARAFESEKHDIIAIRDPRQKNPDDISGAATYGLIAGGCALAGILILFLAWRCSRRRGMKDNLESQSDKAELDSSTGTVFELDKANEIFELNGKPSRVEAPNPDFKCEYDVEDREAEEQGPFELPASEPSASATAHEPWGSFSPPPTPDDELISPIEGTISTGAYSVSTYHNTVSPITPIEPHPAKHPAKEPVKEKR